MNKLISLTIALMFLASCTESIKEIRLSDYQKIESFYKKHKYADFNAFKFVIIINDEGDCLNCNNMFAKTISKSIDNNKLLFIVSESGAKVDISAYIDNSKKNVIWDTKSEFDKLNLVKRCTIFELKDKKIINKTEISSNNIETFQFIDSTNKVVY